MSAPEGVAGGGRAGDRAGCEGRAEEESEHGKSVWVAWGMGLAALWVGLRFQMGDDQRRGLDPLQM